MGSGLHLAVSVEDTDENSKNLATGYQLPSPSMEPACLPRDEKTILDLGFPCSDLWVCINLQKLGESVNIFI
jgi:hypothetical protein